MKKAMKFLFCAQIFFFSPQTCIENFLLLFLLFLTWKHFESHKKSIGQVRWWKFTIFSEIFWYSSATLTDNVGMDTCDTTMCCKIGKNLIKNSFSFGRKCEKIFEIDSREVDLRESVMGLWCIKDSSLTWRCTSSSDSLSLLPWNL